MKPIRNRVLAEVLPKVEHKSGLILGAADLDAYRCKVLEIGPRVKYIKVGDVVRYNHRSTESFSENGKDYVFPREDEDILFLM